jgi:DNA-binding helix-hairpin-helix protein with protein kinase domain
MNVAGAFATLHSIGCSYQDVNEGSFFINPIDGDIRICDCDNVAPFGVGGLDIKGTGFFMAPEVILGISMPDAESDRFSLAVILFRMFYLDHPLEGTATLGYALTDGISARLFGRNPVFVYDPEDDSNRPHPKVHVNVIVRWKMFPPELREAFTRVFTDGLKNRGARLTGAQWIDVLVRVRGQLLAADGQEGFVNAHRAASSLDDYFVLRFQEYVVALGQNSCLYRYQTDNSSLDYKTVVGMVYSTASGSLELCNVSTDNWVAYHDGGTGIMICPGMALDLMPGLRIDFSGVIGQVD